MRRLDLHNAIGSALLLATLSGCAGDVAVLGNGGSTLAQAAAAPTPPVASSAPLAQSCSAALHCAP